MVITITSRLIRKTDSVSHLLRLKCFYLLIYFELLRSVNLNIYTNICH